MVVGATLVSADFAAGAPPEVGELLEEVGGERTVLVVGDHVGFTQEEQDAMQHLGAIKASLGPVPLLASHCIVLAHAVLDAANVARAAR